MTHQEKQFVLDCAKIVLEQICTNKSINSDTVALYAFAYADQMLLESKKRGLFEPNS